MELINKTELKRLLTKFLYLLSPFHRSLCANCRHNCHSLFGKCEFKEKVYVRVNGEWVRASNSFADICDDINERLS